MKSISALAVLIAATLLTSCSLSSTLKTLDGRNRQPINPPGAQLGPQLASESSGRAESDHQAPLSEPQEARKPSPPTPLHERGRCAAEGRTQTFSIKLPYAGTAIKLAPSTAAELISLAQGAKVIHLHGRTDASVYSAGDEQVALYRAIAVRNYLVAHGVDPRKVQLDYVSGSDHVADNTTEEGRSRNRRVEIKIHVDESAPE